jgi:imidazoleglycerol-phosphate dehydratase
LSDGRRSQARQAGGTAKAIALDSVVMTSRSGAATRGTAETEVEVTIDLDGEGDATVDTGLGFFDHMLNALAAHGLFDLTVRADGDLEIDAHHLVEDVGIVLGEALDDALGDRRGITRYADRRVPMDEAVATVVLDISGRPLFRFDGAFSAERVGGMDSGLARHFWRSLAMNAGLTLHAEIGGGDAHHEVEALFKAGARALDDATRIDERRTDAPSTKGEL